MRISDWSSDVCSSDLWHMLEYFTLLALALVGLGIAMPFASDVAHFVAGFLSFVALITLIVLMMLQNWQGSEHAKILYIVHDFANFPLSARLRKSRITRDIHRYFMLATIMIKIGRASFGERVGE